MGRALKIREVDLNPKWLHVKTSFVDGPLQTFLDEHEFDPFFWIWDFDNRPNDVLLVRLPPGFRKHFPYVSGTAFRNINLKFIGVL